MRNDSLKSPIPITSSYLEHSLGQNGPCSMCRIIFIITHLDEAGHDTPDTAL